jgi:hypothetical protein
MDIYCPRCAEPWSIDSIHDEVDARQSLQGGSRSVSFNEVLQQFQAQGCKALTEAYGDMECEKAQGDDRTRLRAEVASAMYDLLGDDIDGAAAMMEDFGF